MACVSGCWGWDFKDYGLRVQDFGFEDETLGQLEFKALGWRV